jgi:hypothetical protein
MNGEAGGSRKLRDEELHNLCCSQILIIRINSKRDETGVYKEWGKGEMHTEFWSKYVKGRDLLEDLGVDWRIILKICFMIMVQEHGLD